MPTAISNNINIFNTHVHGDHWLGNQAIVERYPAVKIYAHPNMIEHSAAIMTFLPTP
jgi:glyoxylase-like metal-dependent hydrolase (beta-lactamase superfamily II)